MTVGTAMAIIPPVDSPLDFFFISAFSGSIV